MRKKISAALFKIGICTYVTYSCLMDPLFYTLLWEWLVTLLQKGHTALECIWMNPDQEDLTQASVMQEEVDIVYTWVNGADAQHTAARLQWSKALGVPASAALDHNRFYNHGELRLSLRSVEEFLPWIRYIFIVTDKQVPSWLNIHHPKIRMVDHSDIFPDKKALPTFNSHAIEFQLHRIEELGEYFIYCNDDMFFARACSKQDFFSRTSAGEYVPNISFGEYLLPIWSYYSRKRRKHLWNWARLKYVIERSFPGYRLRSSINHQATAMKKSFFRESVMRFESHYHRVSYEKFRTLYDIPPIGMICHAALAQKKALQHATAYRYFDSLKGLRNYFLQPQRRAKLACINRVEKDENICELMADLGFCSQPSSFELRQTS